MKIFLTGGTGFLGSALINEFTTMGHSILVATRKANRSQVNPVLSYCTWNPRDESSWWQFLEGIDAVIHLAGEPIGPKPWTSSRKTRIRESRELTGRVLVRAIRRCKDKPKIFIQASAVGYYGTADDREFKESDPSGQDFLAQTCLAWEQSTRDLDDLGLRRLILRTGLVLDRKQGMLPFFMLPFKCHLGSVLGSGRAWMSWVHIDDFTAAVKFLMMRESSRGPYNLTALEPKTHNDFMVALGQVMERHLWLRIPAWPIKVFLGEMAELLILKGQRVKPQRLLDAGYDFKFPQLSLALTDLLSH